ncbi:WG repeat-containing protein [Hymenobacter sp. BT730]|uniref:WG repeat-containing protein n=1 Tax=Hymenobacter sp. BT730 TaxID=3063332 RepID=UPI0026E0FFBC|nr:WG repeat-containing protein [Hymenobacter sp. BT730]
MFYEVLFSDFPTPAQQAQYAAVRDALQAEASAPHTLLLGRLPAGNGLVLDAVLIRPHAVVILLLEPRGGHLTLTDFAAAPWQLAGSPMPFQQAANPYQAFQQQKAALAEFLRPQLTAEQANLNFTSGLLLFGEPVTFAPAVEAGMSAVPGTSSFHLLADPARFTRRLSQLATPEIDLSVTDLSHLAQTLGAAPTASQPTETEEPLQNTPEYEAEPAPAAPENAGDFFREKAAQLWRWLGADDIEDVDRSAYPTTAGQNHLQEKQELEQLRATMQAELARQLQAMEARDAEREQSIAQLRAQLAQAPAIAPEATTLRQQLAAESQEKEALEEAIRASQAESAARNQALDAKIRQLEEQMQRQSATTQLKGILRPGFRRVRAWRQRLPGLGMVAAGAAALGLVFWGVSHFSADAPHPFQKDGLWGYADADGDLVIPARYTSVSEFDDNGNALVKKEGAYGFIDADGDEVLPPAYDALKPYADGYARVRIGELYTFVDEDGQEFPQYFYNALDFSEGRAAVLNQRGWFYITGPEETETPPPVFQEAYSFHKGVARVKINGEYTFITPSYLSHPDQGTEPFGRYSQASDFIDGKARVTQGGKTFFIDADGDPIEN